MSFFLDLLKSFFTQKQQETDVVSQPVAQPAPVEQAKPAEVKPIELLKLDTTNSRKWKYIIIHHSEIASGDVKTWAAIKAYHTSWRYNDETISEEKAKELMSQGKTVVAPWSDIGYHFGVASNKNLTQFEYEVGRSLATIGSHAVGFNDKGIGICCLGSFNKTIPSNELYNATIDLVKKLQGIYNIPDENVIGHRETYDLLKQPRAKDCPGTMYDMVYFRKLLKGSL